ARGKNPRYRRHLVKVDPQPAHRVMHSGEDLHRGLAWIVADEFLVDLKDAFELAVECRAIDVGKIEISSGLPIDSKSVLVHNLMDSARRYIARDQIAVFGIPLFQEI